MKRRNRNLILIWLSFQCLIAAQLVAQSDTDGKPLTIGVVEQIDSKVLGEKRTINIYLPENFETDKATTYPVVYVLDGGVEEDFIHVTGLIRYNTQPWINRFPKSIIVGIENTNRQRDFTFAVSNLDFLEKAGYSRDDVPSYGGSAKYIEFLERELQPYIESRYRGDKQRTVIGESLAGLLAAEILLEHPHLFDTYIIISPSLWWGGEALLRKAENFQATDTSQQIKVYIGAPQKEEDPQMYQSAESLYAALNKTQSAVAHFDHLSEELHSTVMHQAVYNAFKKLYPKTAYSK